MCVCDSVHVYINASFKKKIQVVLFARGGLLWKLHMFYLRTSFKLKYTCLSFAQLSRLFFSPTFRKNIYPMSYCCTFLYLKLNLIRAWLFVSGSSCASVGGSEDPVTSSSQWPMDKRRPQDILMQQPPPTKRNRIDAPSQSNPPFFSFALFCSLFLSPPSVFRRCTALSLQLECWWIFIMS